MMIPTDPMPVAPARPDSNRRSPIASPDGLEFPAWSVAPAGTDPDSASGTGRRPALNVPALMLEAFSPVSPAPPPVKAPTNQFEALVRESACVYVGARRPSGSVPEAMFEAFSPVSPPPAPVKLVPAVLSASAPAYGPLSRALGIVPALRLPAFW